MNQQYFKFENLAVGYNGKALIHNINVDIQKGEIVTLIGPNGAGKSTILKSITKQLKMLCGTVYLDKESLNDFSYKELSSKMAVVLTERMKPELMTCFDIVATGRYPYTGNFGILTTEDEQKVYEAMKSVNAEEIGNREFTAVSDGQRQRVLLARAICQEPELMILDEPTSFLDVKHKLELLSILRNMAKEKGITVVMSLHEIDLAQKVSDKIICVKGKELFCQGKPEEIFEKEKIKELYDIDNGFFDPLFGSLEMPKIQGKPKVFVISDCGRGISVYRKLQRENIPFAAGILYKNDIDYSLARLLAVEVAAEEPFCSISDSTYEYALKLMNSCEKVICTEISIGDCNKKIKELIEEAAKTGKLEMEAGYGV